MDLEFLERTKKLLKIAIPKWKSKETFTIVMLTGLLFTRTYLSIWLADVNGSIVKALVNRCFKDFIKRVLVLLLFAVPSSIVNSGMEYFSKMLALNFRERLTKYFHERYLQKMLYYKTCNLDSRIANPDQRLTQDIEKWSLSLANLFLNFTKPVLDLVLFSRKLAELVGYEGPAMIVGWYILSGLAIRYISPSFGRLTAREQELEGEYRHKHNELIAHSEEIAFYNGSEWEKTQINSKFSLLYAHVRKVLHKRFLMGIYDSMLVKYGASMVGYTVLGLPIFGPRRAEYLQLIGNDTAVITKDYVRNSSLLINLAKAIGRIFVSYKDVQNLAGYTTLISELKEVLDDLDEGKYQRTQVVSSNQI